MKRKTGVFDSVSYVTGLVNNNRNIEERSLNEICDHLIQLCSYSHGIARSLLDIGCGTGRFAIPLAQRDRSIKVLCLDSSENMLDVLRSRARRLGVVNIQILLDDFMTWTSAMKYDVVFMSAVIHLLKDRRAAFERVADLQARGGHFVLRTPFKEQIDRVDVYKRVPEALELYRASHPTQGEIQELANGAGYSIEEVREFIDIKHLARDKFLDLFHERKHSAFWEIPERKFQERLRDIEEETKGQMTIKCSSGTSLITMRKRSGQPGPTE